MDELSGSESATQAPDHTCQPDRPDVRTTGDAGDSRDPGPAETLTREQYARQMRDRPSAGQDDPLDQEADGGRGPETARTTERAEPRSRTEIPENQHLAEPRSRLEVADEARAGTVEPIDRPPPEDRGTLAETPAGRQDRGSQAGGQPGDTSQPAVAARPDAPGGQGGATRQEHADGYDGPYSRFSVVQADRTVGDTSPAGIGLKPTGEQLGDMESDKLSRADRFRKEFYRKADDIQDVTEKTANQLQALLGPHPPAGHAETAVPPPIETSPPPPVDAGNIATAGLAVGLLADRVIHWTRDFLRRSKG